MLSGLGVLLAVTAWIRGPFGVGGALMVASAFLTLPLASGLLAKYRLSKIGAVAATAPHLGTLYTAPALETPTGRDTINDAALAMRPRRARLSARGYVYLWSMGVVTALVAFLVYRCLQILATSPGISTVPALLLVLVCGVLLWQCFSFFRNSVREKRLLSNGELSHGFVVTQSNSRNGSKIVYRYQDSVGNVHFSRVTDFSGKLCEQMPIHVFYNPLNSGISATLEGSLYRVR